MGRSGHSKPTAFEREINAISVLNYCYTKLLDSPLSA
jgi:hypothetical protein